MEEKQRLLETSLEQGPLDQDQLSAVASLESGEESLNEEKVFSRRIDWKDYHGSGIITEEEYDLVLQYDGREEGSDLPNRPAQSAMLGKEGVLCVKTFLNILARSNKTETIQTVLTWLDQLLEEDLSRTSLFEQLPVESLSPLLKTLLHREDIYSLQRCSRVLTHVTWKEPKYEKQLVDPFLGWIVDQLHLKNQARLPAVLASLQQLLRNTNTRIKFHKKQGLYLLVELLDPQTKSHLQLLYQTVCCVWMLSYVPSVVSEVRKTSLIVALAEVIKTVSKEKVLRVSFATLRNLLDHQTYNDDMLHAGLMKTLETLSVRKWADEDIVEDLEIIGEKLTKNLHLQSSFDTYVEEIQSGMLEWTPVHQSERFWRESIAKFESNDFQILRVLINLLKSSIPRVVAVACFDIGEFIRHHPRGRSIIQDLGGKTLIMTLMMHENQEVKKQALLCVQKLMVHNWEYLNR